jgi:hypothetical protein
MFFLTSDIEKEPVLPPGPFFHDPFQQQQGSVYIHPQASTV